MSSQSVKSELPPLKRVISRRRRAPFSERIKRLPVRPLLPLPVRRSRSPVRRSRSPVRRSRSPVRRSRSPVIRPLDNRVKFIINGTKIIMYPDEWPYNSYPRNLYEGDKYAKEFIIKNDKISKNSLNMILDIILKEPNSPQVNPDDVDWDNFGYSVRYFGITSLSIDYIYPLFLTEEDRGKWYKDYNIREQYAEEDLKIDIDLIDLTNIKRDISPSLSKIKLILL